MWELLQELENLWWKPYWKNLAELSETEKHVRLLTSASSWLWQFVCENGMVDKQKEEILIEFYDNLRWRTNVVYDDVMYEYRVIESALCDEDKLESFILENIKL